MAKRYIGSAVIRLTFDDRSDAYRGTVAVDGVHVWTFDGIRLSPHDRSRISVDCPEAYDRAASAVASFGSDPMLDGDETDAEKHNARARASAIDDAVGCDMDDAGRYFVRRGKSGDINRGTASFVA